MVCNSYLLGPYEIISGKVVHTSHAPDRRIDLHKNEKFLLLKKGFFLNPSERACVLEVLILRTGEKRQIWSWGIAESRFLEVFEEVKT